MIERVVENWLTNANERQFQIPFCQMLAAEGETVVYISPHGQREQGKDVITIAKDKVPCCYQLKGGRVALSDWRKYYGEVNELVIYPISHPSIHSKQKHRSYFVTNGTVADPVLGAIESANRAWMGFGAKKLRLIAKDELVSRFVKAHGTYLPRDPDDFRKLLNLIARDGHEPFATGEYVQFIESLLPIRTSARPTNKEVARAVSSAVLLTSYAAQHCERENNHWALFQAWVMAASYILSIAQKFKVAKKWWVGSLELAELAAIRALESLLQECKENRRFFTTGNALTDAPFYGPRIVILCGLLACLNLYRRITKKSVDFWIYEFLVEYLPKIKVWGEASIPFLWAAALEVEHYGNHRLAEGLIFQLLTTVVEVNAPRKGAALPNPYWGPEAAVRLGLELDTPGREEFNGASYTAEPLIDFLVRRMLRRSLSLIWEKITHISFAEFSATSEWEWFRWRAEHGSLTTSIPKAPESWTRLQDHVADEPARVPSLLKARPELAVLLTLALPHRFTCGSAALVERALA